jgi:hypothetical protein
MRYEKKVIVLSSLLAALLLTWGLGIVFSPERVAARSESAKLIAGKTSDVVSLSLKTQGGAGLEISRSGALWVLADGQAKLPVQASRVDSFLKDLAAISRLRVVARSKDSWAGFELDEAKARRATLKDAAGKVIADLWFGSYGPTGSEIYLRKGGSDLSYTAETGVASYLGADRSSWLDLRVLGTLKESDVQSISVKSSIVFDAKAKTALNLDYNLLREGKGWKSGAAQLDAEAVAALIRSVIGLQGVDFVAAPPPEAFPKVQAKIGLELGNGQSKAIEVGAPSGTDRFFARISGEPLVFLVSTYNLRAALKSLAELAAKK